MAKDFDSVVKSGPTSGDGTYVGPAATMVSRSYDNGSDPTVQRSMAARSHSEVLPDRRTGEPTPDTYLQDNPTVLPFMKDSPRRAAQFERNAFCRYIGGIGPYFCFKHRSWLMGLSALITFTCIILLIVPFISTTDSADLLLGFSWGKAQLHWKLMIPVDWTDHMYLGLGGMTNVTQEGHPYYVKYTSKECTEIFGSTCSDCNAATIAVLVFLSISIAAAVFGLILDVHRIFLYFDYNLSKFLALVTHFVFGVIFPVLAYVTFLQNCYLGLPGYAVHQGQGKKGVGIYFVWELSVVSHVLLAVIILRPLSGILHLLVPTPKWANNKGMKAARNQGADKAQMMDPWDENATAMMGNGADVSSTVTKPRYGMQPVDAVPVGKQTLTHSDVVRNEDSSPEAQPDMRTDMHYTEAPSARIDYGAFISARGGEDDVPDMPATVPAANDGKEAEGQLDTATGEGSSATTPKAALDSFVDPFEREDTTLSREDSVYRNEAAEGELQAAGGATTTVPAEAAVETKPASKKSKKSKKGRH